MLNYFVKRRRFRFLKSREVRQAEMDRLEFENQIEENEGCDSSDTRRINALDLLLFVPTNLRMHSYFDNSSRNISWVVYLRH